MGGLRERLTAGLRGGLPLLCVLSLVRAEAGTITGTVKAQGKEGTDDAARGGKYASRQFKFAERVNYEEMHDFVVYIEGRVGTNWSAPRNRSR